MSARLVLLVGAALLCGGCEVPSDIGKPCVLVKRSQSGQKYDPVRMEDINVDQDFISFGSLDCEDLVCVRDARSPVRTTGEGSELRVLGYCSKACVADNLQNPCAVNHPDADAQVKERMSCRPLLLDQQALDDLRAKDPAGYRATFGDNASPYFCASTTPVTTTGNN
jgi:hypothetical protein